MFVIISLIVLFIFYLVCCRCAYMLIQQQHSSGGRFEMLDTTIGDVFLIFMPVFNMYLTIDLLLQCKPINCNCFFKVKR